MKNLVITFVLLFVLAIELFPEDVNTNAPVERFEFRQPITTFFTRIEGVSFFPIPSSGVKNTSRFVNLYGLSLTIGRRLFFHYEAGSGFGLITENNLNYTSMSIYSGIGGGYYLLDKRTKEGVGSSLKLSLLYSFRIDDGADVYGLMGMGINSVLNYDYSFFRNFALRTSLHFGLYGISIGGLAMNYGLSIGLAF